MKILHVASFVGNVGDNASHMGFNQILSSFFGRYEVTKLEIRKFYKNYKFKDRIYFDLDFVNYANKFDLLVIGGGGFLDYWLKDSLTGTTIDMAPDLLSKIKVPTLITSVGCAPHHTVPDGNVEKFRVFLDRMIDNDKIRIAVRNDGSINSFKNEIGAKYLDYIEEVLDSAFFYSPSNTNYNQTDRSYVAINITSDQIKMNSSFRGNIDEKQYYCELRKLVNHIVINKGLDVVFVPHIYRDYEAISILLNGLDDYLIRERISVAPGVQYNSGADTIISVYKNSIFTLGSRFHANVCGLAMGKATIGMAALDRIAYLYDSFDLSMNCILMDSAFSSNMIKTIDNASQNINYIEKIIKDVVGTKRSETLSKYKKYFLDLGFEMSYAK